MQESSLAKIPQVDVKLELDDPPTHEEIRKATMQLKVARKVALVAFQQKSVSTGVKQCSISSRICSPIVGTKGLYRRTSAPLSRKAKAIIVYSPKQIIVFSCKMPISTDILHLSQNPKAGRT